RPAVHPGAVGGVHGNAVPPGRDATAADRVTRWLMGWGESRVTLLAPRWRSVEVAQTVERRAVGGQRLRFIGTEPDPASTADPVGLPPVREWLEARGFTEVEPVPSGANLGWQDVQAELFEQDGELSHVVLTFT